MNHVKFTIPTRNGTNSNQLYCDEKFYKYSKWNLLIWENITTFLFIAASIAYYLYTKIIRGRTKNFFLKTIAQDEVEGFKNFERKNYQIKKNRRSI